MAWIILLIMLVPAAILTATYNRLVLARTALKNAFAQIDVLITRRCDLVPNLVEAAGGYLQGERETLEAVIRACNEAYEGLKSAAADPGSRAAVHQLCGADEQLGGALGKVMALVHAHPELRASQAMALLTEELKATDSRVACARRLYNQAVLTYNSDRERFPGSLAAGLFGFEPAYPIEPVRSLLSAPARLVDPRPLQEEEKS